MASYGLLDVQAAQGINSNYFQFYANGGYGHLPNPVFEDQKTTDEYVARRMLYPSVSLKEYYDNEHQSPYYQLNQNRALTMTQDYDSLQQKGTRLMGQEKTGKYAVYATIPDPSGSVSFISGGGSGETHMLLWVVIGIGAIALLSNVVA